MKWKRNCCYQLCVWASPWHRFLHLSGAHEPSPPGDEASLVFLKMGASQIGQHHHLCLIIHRHRRENQNVSKTAELLLTLAPHCLIFSLISKFNSVLNGDWVVPLKGLSPFCVLLVGYCTLTGWFLIFFSRILALEAAIFYGRHGSSKISSVASPHRNIVARQVAAKVSLLAMLWYVIFCLYR